MLKKKKKNSLKDPEMMATILDSFFAKKDKKIHTHTSYKVLDVFSPTKTKGISHTFFPLSKNCTVRFIQRGHNVTEPQEQKTQTPKTKKKDDF